MFTPNASAAFFVAGWAVVGLGAAILVALGLAVLRDILLERRDSE